MSTPKQRATTAAPAELEFIALRRAVAEAQALGCKFRIAGADVEIAGLQALPGPLQEALRAHQESGFLWSYLGGDFNEDPALDLIEQLGVEVISVTTRRKARDAVRQLIRDSWERPDRPIGLDTETMPLPAHLPEPVWIRINKDGGLSKLQPTSPDRTALSPHLAEIATLQLYAGGRRVFVFRGEARDLLLSTRWLGRQWLVAHNASFDVAFLRHPDRGYRCRFDGRIECSMQAMGLLTGTSFGGGRSLAVAVKKFLYRDVPKELRLSDWGAARLTRGQLAYAAADAVLVYRLWPRLVTHLRRTVRGHAYVLQSEPIAAVADIELRGLLLNREKHARQVNGWARELAEARRDYHKQTGNIPPSTPNEIRAWLKEALDPSQLSRWPRTDSGLLSTETKYLKRLAGIPSARSVLSTMAREKLLSTFGASLVKQINPVTKRLHAHYNIAGSKSGRFSCNNPNLQQLPSARAPEFRRCIVAAPGCLLVGCDWSQVDLRAIAWISGDPVLTALYAAGRDLHRELAAQIQRVPLESVTKEQRQAAKPVSFGAIYGISARGLAENAFADYGIDMSVDEAQYAFDTFFDHFSVVNEWRYEHFNLCQARGQVQIASGRVVEKDWEPGRQLSLPQCCNLPIQGICADAMLRAIPLVHTRFIADGIRGGLVATVHDELLTEVHEDDAESARDLLQQAMIEAFEQTFPGAPTLDVAKAIIGRSWADVKE